eukprot:589937-Hanusia_phi.AAC.1
MALAVRVPRPRRTRLTATDRVTGPSPGLIEPRAGPRGRGAAEVTVTFGGLRERLRAPAIGVVTVQNSDMTRTVSHCRSSKSVG